MKRRIALAGALLIAFVAGFFAGRQTIRTTGRAWRELPAAADQLPVRSRKADLWPVIRVVDGDTLHVRFRGRDESVRLLRINTPERGQVGYGEATRALRRLVEGRKVRLEFERRGNVERDRYGRLLAYVYVGHLNVNVEMVRLGWSPFWTKYGQGRLADEFRKAEKEARAERRGLWAMKRTVR